MRLSREVTHILTEAQEIAAGAGQAFTTGHIILGMLTSTNRAAAVLNDLKVDARRIVSSLQAIKRADRKLTESQDLLVQIEDRMMEAARRCDALLVSSLHLLMALTREKTAIAYRLFSFMGYPPAHVRTMALSRITGPVPRSVARATARRSESHRAFADEPASPVQVAVEEEPPKQMELTPQSSEPKATSPSDDGPGDPELNLDEPENPYVLDPEQFPTLTALGRNLTALAYLGKLDPVIGREAVIDAMIDILNKRRANNPCLVGDPGVGKTAVVEGLAQAMLEAVDRVRNLRNRIIIEIDVGALVAGTELRGSFSRRMAKLKDEVRQAEGGIIVFIDEFHTLVGAGGGDGPLDAANDLKAALARGDFPCIGATTRDEYYRHIERDPALERRFQPIEVDEPSAELTLRILAGLIDRYEAHHGVIYKKDALESAVKLGRRYIVDRRLPDKAINIIDTAAARAVRRAKETVEVRDVAEVVGELASIPIDRLLMSDADRILGIRDYMGRHVIGHGAVLSRIAEVIQRNSAGFNSHRPIGSFLFLGPTGVGKTETAKVLADFLFCSSDSLVRFDMSEYMEKHAVSRLLGAAPGYVGHEEAGQLTAALKRRPYQIVLFDEVEKAHPDVLYVLLQILDEGKVTDSKGHPLNFANSVIIMTSNLGTKALTASNRKSIGFGGPERDRFQHWDEADEANLLEEARKALPPELWGRIQEKCVFRPLGEPEVRSIAQLLISESSRRLEQERDITYTVEPAVIDVLIEDGGYDTTHGARPMRRAVEKICETSIARAILQGNVKQGQNLHLIVSDGEVVVEPEDTPLVQEEQPAPVRESAF